MRIKPKAQLERDQGARFHQKFARMNFSTVKVNDPFVTAADDKANRVQHFCAEPKDDLVRESCMKIGDFSAEFDYEMHRNSDNTYELDAIANTKEEAETCLKYGDLDRLLNYVSDEEDIHGTDALSNACEDYLLDAENASYLNDGDLKDGASDGPQFGYSSSGSESPGFRSSKGAFWIADSSTATPSEFECQSNSLQEIKNCDLSGAARSKWRWGALVEDKFRATSLVSKNTNEFYEYERNFNSGSLSEKHVRTYPETRKYESSSRENRMRKPTQLYIKEFSDLKSEPCKRKGKLSSGAMRGKPLKFRFQEPHQLQFESESVVPVKDSIHRTRVESLTGMQRGWLKKQVPISAGFKSEKEYTASDSEDNQVRTKRSKQGDRRKHQRMWTLSEVMKLVDGIAEYGTGRWTDIKRHLFSSSTYRTPIDLRDKWRNLLRTSSIQKRNKEQNQTQALRALPNSLLQRVRELVNMHPYPKERALSTGSKGSSISLSRTKFR